MKAALLMASVLAVAGCDTWAAHPVTMSAVSGGVLIGGGALLIDEGHPIAGGVMLGSSVGVMVIAIALGIIIDNFNEAHKGAKACKP